MSAWRVTQILLFAIQFGLMVGLFTGDYLNGRPTTDEIKTGSSYHQPAGTLHGGDVPHIRLPRHQLQTT